MLKTTLIFIFITIWSITPFAQADSSNAMLTIDYWVNGEKKSYTCSVDNENQHANSEDFSLEMTTLYSEQYRLNIKAKNNITLEDIRIQFEHASHPVCTLDDNKKEQHFYFCNGFQSWTTSQEMGIADKVKKLAGILKPYGQNLGDYNHYYKYPNKKGILHSWSFTYKRLEEQYFFMGSLNDHKGYTLFIHDANTQMTTIKKDCRKYTLEKGQTFEAFDLMFVKGDYQRVWQTYMNAFPPNPSKAKPAIGWTSWYNYYTKINKKIIQDNLNNFANANIPLDIFQIDDGYQSAIGDWLSCNDKFPEGMKPIADSIHAKGYQAGLWLAPFVASKKSKVFQEHPDWFLKNDKGKHIRAAINVTWGGPYFPLDIYNPEVRTHLKKVIQGILYDWNFDMIKVDFLFAVCLKELPKKTRGEVMYDAMKLLREYAGDKLILGCGVPLAPSFKLVDYCRIGNDAHLGWEFGILKLFGNAERPSTWSTLTNSILRFPLSESAFLNDPDVFILRKENTNLSDEEKYTMLLINNLLGAVIFNSDNIAKYDSLQLQQYKSIFPYVRPENVRIKQEEEVYQIRFDVGERNYLFLSNLGKKVASTFVDKGLYYNGRTKELLRFEKDSTQIQLEKHRSKLYYVFKGDKSELMGGQNHIIPGQEVDKIERLASNSFNITFKDNAQTNTEILFYIANPETFTLYINGEACDVEDGIAVFKKN